MPRWLRAVLKGAFVAVKALRRSRVLKGKGVDEAIAGVDEAVRILEGGESRSAPLPQDSRPWSPPSPPTYPRD